ncbi:hypothetical protein L0F63_000466 [Massospora cicadina]|nr:hypothetical protein L0F63_000466 [Massospora cicadina]
MFKKPTGTLWSKASVGSYSNYDTLRKVYFQEYLSCDSMKQHSGYINLSVTKQRKPNPGVIMDKRRTWDVILVWGIQWDRSLQNRWAQDTHLLVLDQPIGTGFSRGTNRVTNTSVAAGDVYKALVKFFDMFPKYQNRSFHMFSESYGGHYLPKIASLILKHKPSSIQLSSIVIGNGLIDPRIQFRAYFRMACQSERRLLPKRLCSTIKDRLTSVYEALDACYSNPSITGCQRAWKLVNDAILVPYISNGRSIYNINEFTFGEDEISSITNSTEVFFNQPHIQTSLNVPLMRYKAISFEVYYSFHDSGDVMDSLTSTLASLIDRGVRVLLYAGDADFLCNWVGLQDFAEQLSWFGAKNSGPNGSGTTTITISKRSFGAYTPTRTFTLSAYTKLAIW